MQWMTDQARGGTSVLALALTLVCIAGCMTRPEDGAIVGPTHKPVGIGGYFDEPSSQVQVLAQPVRPGYVDELSWKLVGYATSASDGIVYDGGDWYLWSLTATVPRYAWAYGYRGGKTRLRARAFRPATGMTEFRSAKPGFGRCAVQASGVMIDLISNCLNPPGDYAEITTNDYCEGPIVPDWHGALPGNYQYTFDVIDDNRVIVGKVLGSPTAVRVGGATCTRWSGNNAYYVCALLGPNGIFADVQAARDWLANPDPSVHEALGHYLLWNVDYREPFNSGPSCSQRNWAGRGTMHLFGGIALRDYLETIDPDMGLDPDPDNDMIPNSIDQCDNEPEDYNGFEDHDGCPDEVPDGRLWPPFAQQVCGIGAAPSGFAVTGLLFRRDCGGSGDPRFANAMYVTDYRDAMSRDVLRICNGFSNPPGWVTIQDNIPSTLCSAQAGLTGFARIARKP